MKMSFNFVEMQGALSDSAIIYDEIYFEIQKCALLSLKDNRLLSESQLRVAEELLFQHYRKSFLLRNGDL